MSTFEVRGAEQFLKLSKQLKAAGNTGMRTELNKRVRVAAKPAVAAVKAAARSGYPQRGGAAAFIASKRVTVTTTTGSTPGVKIKVNKQDERLDTQGRLYHPVFGRRPGVVQQVKPGVMSAGFQSAAPAIRPQVVGAVRSVLGDIASGL